MFFFKRKSQDLVMVFGCRGAYWSLKKNIILKTDICIYRNIYIYHLQQKIPFSFYHQFLGCNVSFGLVLGKILFKEESHKHSSCWVACEHVLLGMLQAS